MRHGKRTVEEAALDDEASTVFTDIDMVPKKVRVLDQRVVSNRRTAPLWKKKKWSDVASDISIRTQYEEGMQLMQRSAWSEAEQKFRLTLELKPDHAEAAYQMGVLCMKRDEHRCAISFFDKAIETGESDTVGQAIVQRASCHSVLEDYHKCIADCDRVDPAYKYRVNAIVCKCNALRKLDLTEEALDILHSTLDRDGDHDGVWFLLGIIAREKMQYYDALAYFKYSLRHNGKRINAWINMGQTLAMLGRKIESYECMKQATEIDPTSSTAWFFMGKILFMMNQYAEALECYQKCQRSGGDSSRLKDEIYATRRKISTSGPMFQPANTL